MYLEIHIGLIANSVDIAEHKFYNWLVSIYKLQIYK